MTISGQMLEEDEFGGVLWMDTSRGNGSITSCIKDDGFECRYVTELGYCLDPSPLKARVLDINRLM